MSVSLFWLADSISCIRRVNFSHRTVGLTLDFLRKNGNFTHLFQSSRYTHTHQLVVSGVWLRPLLTSLRYILDGSWAGATEVPLHSCCGTIDWCASRLSSGRGRVAVIDKPRLLMAARASPHWLWVAAERSDSRRVCRDAQALTLQHNLSRCTGSLFRHKAHSFMELRLLRKHTAP